MIIKGILVRWSLFMSRFQGEIFKIEKCHIKVIVKKFKFLNICNFILKTSLLFCEFILIIIFYRTLGFEIDKLSFVNILIGVILTCQKLCNLGRHNLRKINQICGEYLKQCSEPESTTIFFQKESEFLKSLLYNISAVLFDYRNVLEFINVIKLVYIIFYKFSLFLILFQIIFIKI